MKVSLEAIAIIQMTIKYLAIREIVRVDSGTGQSLVLTWVSQMAIKGL